MAATKPAYCFETTWADINSASSGLRFCNGGIDPVGILQIFARILSGKSADYQGSTKGRSVRPKPKAFSIRPKPQNFSIRPKPKNFSIRPKPKDFSIQPSPSATEVLESLLYNFSA